MIREQPARGNVIDELAAEGVVHEFKWKRPTQNDCPNEEPARLTRSDAEAMITVVRRLRGPFRGCYQNLLERDPRARGKVLVFISVDCTGTVEAIAANATLADRDMMLCLFHHVKHARFTPSTKTSFRGVARLLEFEVSHSRERQ